MRTSKKKNNRMSKLVKALERSVRNNQKTCPHLQGSNPLSDSSGFLTSIVWHELVAGQQPVGVCINCGRKFFPADNDYKKWRKKKSGNKESKGGNPLSKYPLTEKESSKTAAQRYVNDSFSPLDSSATEWAAKRGKKVKKPKKDGVVFTAVY